MGRDLWLVAASWRRLWLVYDVFVVSFSVMAGFYLSPRQVFAAADGNHALPEVILPMYALSFVIVSLAAGMYEREVLQFPLTILTRVFIASFAAWGVVIGVHYMATYQPVGRWIVVISGLTVAVGTGLPRFLSRLLLHHSPVRVFVAGSNRGVAALKVTIARDGGARVAVVGIWTQPLSRSGTGDDAAPDALANACAVAGADILAVEEGISGWVVDQAVECIRRRITVVGLSAFIEHMFGKVPVEIIGPEWVISAELYQTRPLPQLLKRIVDVLLSGIGLIVTLPFWPFIALLVKLSSRGPVFYSQMRVGKNGCVFRLHKFRTMRTDAEASGRAVWAEERDSRVTWIGRTLRRTRIDEIPQFINVLRGDMSFVGPRPERPEFVREFAAKIPHYDLRHVVKPGITGWAQISYRYGAGLEDAIEKLRYDLHYIKHYATSLDILIILRTLGTVFRGSR